METLFLLIGAGGVFVASALYSAGEEQAQPPPPSSVERQERGEDKLLRERVVIVEGLTIVNAHGENAAPHRAPPMRPSEKWRGSTLIGKTSPGELEVLEEKRHALLQSILTLRLPSLPGFPEQSFPIPLSEHPEWVTLEESEEGERVAIDVENVTSFLETFLEREIAPLLPVPSQARLLALPTEGTPHAEVEGRAQDGLLIRENAARLIAHALSKGQLMVTVPLDYIQGTIIPERELGIGPMVLLARGRSNFAGSVPNRAHNVRKALNEYVHGVFLAPQETFSFGSLFGNSISSGNGWKMAMGIFNGQKFEPTPGGGICQSSTTLYRAALLAGLPILTHFHHSMYIKFYREHGEGLDATYYPGSKDLTFLNDMPGYLLIQAYDEGEEAIIEIYGTPDGRTVTLEGPYRASDAPSEALEKLGRAFYANEIAWQYRVTRSDGSVLEEILKARYANAIPEEPPENAGI